MSYELKPVYCGCGGEASIVNNFLGMDDFYLIECLSCGICTNVYDSKAKAIEAWNKAMINTDYATIEGSGDLHFCGYCKADLSNAWIENYNYCPNCKKMFKDKNYE